MRKISFGYLVVLGLSLLLMACGEASSAATSPGLVLTAASTLPRSATASTPISSSLTAQDWPQYGFDAGHSGNDTGHETVVNAANVSRLKPLFKITLPSIADGSPVYLAGVQTGAITHDVVYLTLHNGDLLALDALTGSQIWVKHNPAGSCRINGGGTECYTTSSPALDPNRQFVYSYGLDGYVHKYQVGDGTEITSGGWPELTSRKPFDEKGSSALSLATANDGKSYLYMVHGGYPGDGGDYQGHLTAINLQDGSQHVFNTICSDQTDVHFTEPGQPNCADKQTALWPRVGVVYDADTNRIYTTTGNGPFTPSRHAWGDTVLALNPDGTPRPDGQPLDGYTPTNFQSLQDTDEDIGSTAPTILPVPAGSTIPHLGVQGGKDAILRLINLDNLSGRDGPGYTGGEVQLLGVPQGGAVLSAPAAWVNPADGAVWLFVVNRSGASGLKLTVDSAGRADLKPAWQNKLAGFTPVVVNGVLYYNRSGNLTALDPTTGNQLWKGDLGDLHWQSPILVNGVLYAPDNDKGLTAFSLDGKPPVAAPVSPISPGLADQSAAFDRVWQRTDLPIANGQASRSWLWGPSPLLNTQESYAEGSGGARQVRYYDKSRMEVTRPGGNQASLYFVTNGLLAAEMMRGQLQTGDNRFELRSPAQIGVAGDADDQTGPTYASFQGLVARPALSVSTSLLTRLDRAGNTYDDPATLATYTVKAAYTVADAHHTIAGPFWDFLNSQGLVYIGPGQLATGPLFSPLFYATGLPLTEAYWSKVKVAGKTQDVLMQVFERRVLTYTPSNPAPYRVEMGNVGRQYFLWRYGYPVPDLTITSDSNNKTVSLHSGQVFGLQLTPSNLIWTSLVADPTIVGRLDKIINTPGIYQALRPGQTTVMVRGTPRCDRGTVCPQFVTLFQVKIEVS